MVACRAVSHDAPLPSEQHEYEGLDRLPVDVLHDRRERVFLLFAGLFLGTLAMLNILGLTRFLDLSFTVFGWHIPMPLPVGVLPYPITFLCTDFISELYGRRRANQVVLMGLVLNLWVLGILWLGKHLPGSESPTFDTIHRLTSGAVMASMVAYLAAQFIDVYLFHFWRRITRGRHLWLRNNGSTMVSQLVDSITVILITHYYARGLPLVEGRSVGSQLVTFIVAGYVFKFTAALLDTVPFYLGTRFFTRYLRLPPANPEAAGIVASAAGDQA